MEKFRDSTCTSFINELISKAPVPGGGGASALCASIGTALGGMVASLTIGKKKYADVDLEMRELLARAETIAEELLVLVDKDAEVFEPLSKAYKDRDDTETMEKCLKDAAMVPYEIMEKCCEAITLQKTFAEKGSRLAVSDAGCGAVILKSALQAAALNVYINTKSMNDRSYAEELNSKVEDMINEYSGLADEIYSYVTEELK